MSFIVKEFRKKVPQIEKALYIADYVSLYGDIILGKNVSIWSNTTLRADLASIIIGDNSNIQESCVIHTLECKDLDYKKDHTGHTIIGNNTTIEHGCIIEACRIGNNCLIGAGSTIGDCCIIEDNVFIGANSNITPRTIIRTGELWFGNPAKYMRDLRSIDYEYIKNNVLTYIKLAREYSKK